MADQVQDDKRCLFGGDAVIPDETTPPEVQAGVEAYFKELAKIASGAKTPAKVPHWFAYPRR